MQLIFTATMAAEAREGRKNQALTLGATVASGVGKSLDLPVIGEKPSASKVKKAEDAGVTVLTESEYLSPIES